MDIIFAWIALLQAATAPPPSLPTPMNGDFSRVEAGAPVGWVVNRRVGGDPGMILTVTPEGRAHIAPTTAAAGQPTRLIQRFDAAPWRGKVVRLSARIRVIGAGDHVGLRLNVDRPPPLFGYYDDMVDEPLPAGDWRDVSLTGVIEDDATAIEIGAMLRGRAEIEIDDVVFTEMPQSAAPLSEAASAYLDTAIAGIRRVHMDSARLDWPAVIARARLQAAGAAVPRDTYPAIRGVLSTLGDNHSIFQAPRPPDSAAERASSGAQPLPTYALLDGRFGMVSLPGLQMTAPQDRPHAERYVAVLRGALRIFDGQHLCGWIVDLRGNPGGNMWPMLNGLTPLLGAPPFGGFVSNGGERMAWTLRGGQVVADNRDLGFRGFRVRQAARPVAVLIGPDTASSGEAVAVAFSGRPEARSFGRPTGGYTSANQSIDMPDGALIFVPASWAEDRTGRKFRAAIAPDEAVTAGNEVAAAMRWLATRCR